MDAVNQRGEVREKALRFLTEQRGFADVKHHLGVSDSRTHGLLARLQAQGLVERVAPGLYRRVR